MSLGEDRFSLLSSSASRLFKASIPHPHEHMVFGGVAFNFDGVDKASVILKASKKSDLPILCVVTSAECSNKAKNDARMMFANNVLTHPLMIEAIEDLFVSVSFQWDLCKVGDKHSICFQKLLLNAKGGNKSIAEAYDSGSIYPLIAVLDSQGSIIKTLFGKKCEINENSTSSTTSKLPTTTLSVGQVSNAMIESFLSFHRHIINPVPRYLKHLAREEHARDNYTTAKAFIGMLDSWTGEAEFAQCVGVIGSKAAWFSERELVVIIYDLKVVTYSEIVRFAIGRGRATTIYYTNNMEYEEATKQVVLSRSTNNAKKVELLRLTGSLGGSIRIESANYYLTKSKFRLVPLTDYQRCRINFALSQDNEDEAVSLLSPRQLEILNHFQPVEEYRPHVIGADIFEGWKIATSMSSNSQGQVLLRKSGDLSMLKMSKMALDNVSHQY